MNALSNCRLLYTILFYFFVESIHGEQFHPAAIIPWSQYQKRLHSAKGSSINTQFNGDNEGNTISITTDSSNSYFGSYENVDTTVKRPPSSDKTFSKFSPRNVIRPQIRGRFPTDPSDFKNYKESNNAPKLTEKMIADRPKTNIDMMPTRIPPILEQTRSKQDHRKVASLAIPNGVPMYAGNWETGQPHYFNERKPIAHAANTYSGGQTYQISNDIISPASQHLDSNLVNDIFSQSQAKAGAIPTMVQQSQTQNYFEKLLADGASLDQLSKLAKNLLGVGSNGESGNSGGILEAMTSALRGSSRNLPTSSAAHDDLNQFSPSSANRPQQSMFEKLLSHAAVALNDSLKQKQLNEEAEKEISAKRTEYVPAVQETKQNIKMTKERENSIKLLENMPAEERNILEAAIMSGEIDADSPAIKNLVKDDLTPESKKEKENRLLEWIRSNRPTKTNDIIPTSDKLPYYGKYLGSFAETPNINKKFHPSGALWAVDNRNVIVSKFMFQPGSLLNENVTFWFGPRNPSDNILQDIMPSENGFYVQPKPIEMSVFVMEELPAISANLRHNVAATKMVYGVAPIIANVTRSKRNTEQQLIENKLDNMLIRYKNDSDIDQRSVDSEDLGKSAIVPAGFRLRQPEFDDIDRKFPQPLEWYAGFQPIMLSLPPSKTLSDINWISLRDHKRNETIASLLLPNGPVFQVPKVMKLRPLSPNSPLYNISSGSIEILDMKTIKINSFSFDTDDTSVWFMVGKDILPNVNGNIVPIFEKSTLSFDCESLRSYHNETLVLRLPGRLDMKDVFWLSVFSMKQMISYSHIYLPYNDMQLLPDLSSVATPTCKYSSP